MSISVDLIEAACHSLEAIVSAAGVFEKNAEALHAANRAADAALQIIHDGLLGHIIDLKKKGDVE